MEVESLPQDMGKRRNMGDFHKDDRDHIRRFHVDRGLCQPLNHNFPFKTFGKSSRRFNLDWFEKYDTWNPTK